MNREIYDSLRQIKYFFMRCIMRMMWVFPIEKEKIVFSNFAGKGFGDNPKYIALALHEREKCNMYWITDTIDVEMPEYITQVKYRSFKAMYHLATAKVWVDNIRKEAEIVKRKKQYYVQTWHGNIALKRIEKDAHESLSKFYISCAKRDAKYTDVMLSSCKFSDRLFREAFWYKGEIFKSGSPRIDCLYKKNEKMIKHHFGLDEDVYMVMYAPTFRSDWSVKAYEFDIECIKQAFEKRFKKSVVFLFRMHPNLSKISTYKVDLPYVYDVSGVSDVYEIMCESDALITDYSSLMFEFPICEKKPVFLYARDLDAYDRGFYFNLSSLPYPVSRDTAELYRSVIEYDKREYEDKLDDFYSELEVREDGHASERVADRIAKVLRTK